jgi:hypothetical protein
MDLVFSTDNPFHVVGSLKLSQHKELLDIPKKQFEIVPEYKDRSVTAYRCVKDVYNRKMTVVLVHNPELLKGQLQGIILNIEKCTLKLQELKGRLRAWSEYRITKGKNQQ